MCIFITAYSDRSSDRCQQCSCPNLLGINTYRISRKCCNQRTYRIAKSFRCNTYKKQGVGPPALRRFDVLPFVLLLLTLPFFSCTYKLPISQALCFDIHASDGGCRG